MKLVPTIGRKFGMLFAAVAMAALAVAACGAAEESAPAQVDIAAITAAVQEAVTSAAATSITQEEVADLIAQAAAASSISQEDIEAAVSKAAEESAAMAADDIAAQIAKAAEDNPALTAAEVDELIAQAVAESQSMAAQEIAAQIAKAAEENPALTKEEIAALVKESTLSAADISEVVAQAVEAETRPQYASGGQKYGGTLKVGLVDSGSLDPHLAGLSQGESNYSELTYDNLANQGFDGSVIPDLYESWEGNDDLSVYTVKIRQGAKFHHGPEVTSADIKYTWDRLRNPASASPLAGEISFIENITTPDKYTVVFELTGSNVFLPDLWHDYHARIVPDGITNDEITTGEWGSGPFTLFEHIPVERTVFKRNEDYWKGTGYVDEVIFFYIPEDVTRVEALKTGAIDVIIELNPSVVDELRAAGVLVKQESTSSVRDIAMDNREGSIFADKNLRKAMQYAVDRTLVRNAAQYDLGTNANDHPVGPNDQYYWKEQPIIMQDIDKAKEYLAMAGYPDGIDIELHTTDMSQMLDYSLAFKESVAAAGIDVEIINHSSSTYWEEVWMNPCCPMVAVTWGARPANKSIAVQLKGGGVWNDSYYNNPRLDELLGLANAEIDFDTRKEYFREMQEILIEEVPVIYLMYQPYIMGHQSRIKGLRVHTGGAMFYDNWWIED